MYITEFGDAIIQTAEKVMLLKLKYTTKMRIWSVTDRVESFQKECYIIFLKG